MRKVRDTQLFLGDRGDVRMPGEIRRRGMVAVVDLAIEEAPIGVDREMIVLRIPLVDGAGSDRATIALAIRSVAEMMRTGVAGLVVCSAGLSRSPAIAAGALSFRGPFLRWMRLRWFEAADPRMSPRICGPAWWRWLTSFVRTRNFGANGSLLGPCPSSPYGEEARRDKSVGGERDDSVATTCALENSEADGRPPI